MAKLLHVLGGWICLVGLATQVASAQALHESIATEPIQAAFADVRSVLDAVDLNAVHSDTIETLDALRMMLELDVPNRHRFLLPRSFAHGRQGQEQIGKLFKTAETQNDFRKALENLAEAVQHEAVQAEARSDAWTGYRLRWYASGLRTVYPATSNRKKNMATWSQTEALNDVKVANRAASNHPKILWPAGSYSLLTTHHFEIASKAGAKPSLELAELCEQAFAIWKQMFFTVWSDSQTVAPEYSSVERPKFSVVLFQNKDAYMQALKASENNIALSSGYYDPTNRVAFFYWDGVKTAATVVHELTHQFFYEASSKAIAIDTDNDPGFWVAEGIALYMESMSTKASGGATLADVGGWDSPRLQRGKFRLILNSFWAPWHRFLSANGKQFRENKEITAWYSQACGLAHLWMDGTPTQQSQFVAYLESVYAGRADESLLGDWNHDSRLQDAYRESALQSPVDFPSRPFFASRTDCVLSRSKITSSDLLDWPAGYRSQAWLDLSFTAIDDSLFFQQGLPVSPPWNIGRLTLEATQVTDVALEAISKMKDLAELDLSGCQITDDGLKLFLGNKTIKKIWLTQCSISDQAIETLATMSQLEAVHLMGTQVTQTGWERLLKQRPKLKNNSTAP